MRLLIATLVASLLVAPTAFAQNASESQAQRGAGARAQSGEAHAAGNLDHHIAACMLLGNQEEIALAQFAAQHATHPQVKELAKTLVDQHTKAVEMIQKSAPEIANLQLASADGDQRSGQNSVTSGDRSIAMLQRIKSECLSLTQKELKEHQGPEFDKAFVSQQIGAHLGMLAQLRGSKEFASPELQKVIADGEKMTEMHMAEAKKIMSQIKDETAKTADARERTATPQR